MDCSWHSAAYSLCVVVCAHLYMGCTTGLSFLLLAGCVEHVEVLILKAADTLALMEDTLDSSDAAARHSAITLTLIRTEKTTHSSTMHSAKYSDLRAAIITGRESRIKMSQLSRIVVHLCVRVLYFHFNVIFDVLYLYKFIFIFLSYVFTIYTIITIFLIYTFYI